MDRKEAFGILDKLNAPEHLKRHVSLVGEAADLIIKYLDEHEIKLRMDFIRSGVVIHDIGKIVHPHEMTGAGSNHEPEGQKILSEMGYSSELARVCISHAQWHKMDCSDEELVIALSDKLWKGKRVPDLELRVIDRIAILRGKDRWDIFEELDSLFENIASGGDERLQRSISYY